MDIYIPSSVLKDRHSTLRPHQHQPQQPPQNLPPIVVVSTVAAECSALCPTSSTCTCAATCPTHARYSPMSVAGTTGVAESTSSSHQGPHLYCIQRSNTNNYHLAEEEERFDRRNSEDEADEREYQEYKRLRKLKKQHKKEVKQMKALEKREKKEDKRMKKEMAKNEKEMRKKRQHSESHGGEDRTTTTTGPTTIVISASLSATTSSAAAAANVSNASAVATVVREPQYDLDGEEWSRGGQSTAKKDSTSRVRRSRVASWFLGKRKDDMASMQYQELELEPVQALFDQGKGQGGEHQEGQELQLPQQQQQQHYPQQQQQQQRQQVWRREGTLSDLKVIPSQHHPKSTLYSRKAASSVSLYLDPSSSSLTLHPNHQPYNNTLHQGPPRQSQLSSAVSEPHLGGGGRLGSGRKRTSTGCYLQRVWCKIRQSHKSASRLMMTPGSLQGDESSSKKDL
ncbi:hypothetical protein EC968_008757 [Mortierella alpina]|nr:hypothetical protein EC968_008757 [Mortierella alpina]